MSFRRLMIRAGMLLIVGALLAVPADVWAGEAAMFRGNARHTGVYAAAGAPTFKSVKWVFHTKGHIISSPAIAGGAAFASPFDDDIVVGVAKLMSVVAVLSSPVFVGDTVNVGSMDGNLYALD